MTVLLFWIAAAHAKAPMNGVLVGVSAGPSLVLQEPALAEPPEWLTVGPDFGFELWGTSGKRDGGIRAGILFDFGLTPPQETTKTSIRFGGGVVVGGIWGAKKGSYGTASVGLGAAGYDVAAREIQSHYGAVGVWLRGEYATGLKLGKSAVLEIGPTVTLVPPIRIGDDEAGWTGNYWGHAGLEVTLLAFGKSRGGGSAAPTPTPAPVRPAPQPGGAERPKPGPGSDSPKKPGPGSDPDRPKPGPGSDSPPKPGPGSDSPKKPPK